MDIYPRSSGFPEDKDKIIFSSCIAVILTAVIAGFIFPESHQVGSGLVVAERDVEITELLPIFNGNTFIPVAEPSNETNVVKSLTVVATAYSSTPWETWGDPFLTAAGTRVRNGIIANNLLPFGTKIRIPEIYGEKIFVVEDRMNSKKGYYHIDIWFPSYGEALDFGAKKTYIEILEN